MAKKEAEQTAYDVLRTKRVGEFTLSNDDKLNRAVYGNIGAGGTSDGTGVGEDAPAEKVLAAYDRLGGLILKGRAKVKLGSFFDFETKKPRKEPEVVLEFRDLKGRKVELADGEEVPIEVQAAEKIREEEAEESREKAKKAEAKKAATKKGKGKGKKAADFEEEEIVEEDEESEDEEEADEDVE